MVDIWGNGKKKNFLHVVLLLMMTGPRLQLCEEVAGLGWRK